MGPMRGLAEGRIAHAEPRAEVLGKQLDGGAIPRQVRLRQVLDRLHNEALTLDIAWITSALARFAFRSRSDGNSENFSHTNL